MVNIKGLDKARVLKALYEHSHVQGLGAFQAVHMGVPTLEYFAGLLEQGTYFDYLGGRVLKVELSGDEFDERLYDRDCGEGAAQRAVDSVRAEQEGGEGAAENTGSEKKELTMEEKAKLTKETIGKVMNILTEVPPDVATATCVMLKTMLPGPSMGGPFAPPMGGLLGMRTSMHITDESPFKGRFG